MGVPRVDEPLRDARVDAPADGIFANADRQREGPHLELLGRPFGIGTNNPEHELTHAGIVGFQGQYVRGAGQTDCSPTRSVVNPVVIENVTTVDSRRSRYSSSSGPVRRSAGPRKDSVSPVRRTSTSPTPHSSTTTSPFPGFPPDSSHAWTDPSVGCPANGSSPRGKKTAVRNLRAPTSV
jgi:hypothetical protein